MSTSCRAPVRGRPRVGASRPRRHASTGRYAAGIGTSAPYSSETFVSVPAL